MPQIPQSLWGYQSVKIHQLTVLMGLEEVMHVYLEDSISPVEGTTKQYHKSGTSGSDVLGPDTNADLKSIVFAEVS